MKSLGKTVARIFFNPETIVTFLIGSLALSVSGNACYDIVKKATGESYPAYGEILIGSIAILLLSAYVVTRIIRSRQRVEVEPLGQPPEPRQGLILLVSREEPCHAALKPHLGTVKHLWMICSTQSLGAAEAIRRDYSGRIPSIHEPRVLNNVYSPREAFDVVRKILNELPVGLQPEDVACDYTGLTAHGSIGMALAALNADAPLQAVPAKLDENFKPAGSLPAIKVRLSLVRRAQ